MYALPWLLTTAWAVLHVRHSTQTESYTGRSAWHLDSSNWPAVSLSLVWAPTYPNQRGKSKVRALTRNRRLEFVFLFFKILFGPQSTGVQGRKETGMLCSVCLYMTDSCHPPPPFTSPSAECAAKISVAVNIGEISRIGVSLCFTRACQPGWGVDPHLFLLGSGLEDSECRVLIKCNRLWLLLINSNWLKIVVLKGTRTSIRTHKLLYNPTFYYAYLRQR